MLDMHSKYDNRHKNGMFYALIYINNQIIACVNCMLSAMWHNFCHSTPQTIHDRNIHITNKRDM